LSAGALVSTGGAAVSADSSGAAPGSPRGAAASISAGSEHTCVLDVSNDIRCWGFDRNGQIGDGEQGDESSAPRPEPSDPTDLPGGLTATAIALGGENSCVVLANRTITCWGSDQRGQIGDENVASNIFFPQNVITTNDPVVGLAVGNLFICAQYVTGQVNCFGNDDSGQLGNGGAPGTNDIDSAARAPLIALPEGRTATAVSAGDNHACAVLDNGDISCWGDNSSGQVGNGSTATEILAPTAAISLPGSSPAVGVTAGGDHTCALLDNGDVACWGNDDDGQLGNGAATGDKRTAALVNLPRSAVAVAAGQAHTCAVLDNDDLTCWGDNSSGQIGNGGTADQAAPTASVLSGVRAMALGNAHTCALIEATNGVTCWGENSQGQLGIGNLTDRAAPGAAIAGVTVAENASTTVAPSGLFVAVPPNTKNRANLNWVAPTDNGGSAITGYRIQQSVDGGDSWLTLVANTGTTTTSAQLTNARGGNSTFRVAAINAINVSSYSFPSAAVDIETDQDIIPVAPRRYLDTRDPAGATFDGQSANQGVIQTNSFIRTQIADRGGLEDDIVGAVLNVTIVAPQSNGFATVYPCSDTPPTASTINYRRGENTANVAITKLDDGDVCVFTSAPANILIDVTGILPSTSSIETVDPIRLLDSRAAGATIDGESQNTGGLTAGEPAVIQIAGRDVIPDDVGGAIVNVTAVRPQALGFVAVYPCQSTPPTVANVNFRDGVNTATAAISQLNNDGELCAFSQTDTDLIIDVVGYLPASSAVETALAARLVDTRNSGGPNPAGQVLEVQVAGTPGIPSTVTAAILNVAIVQPNGRGFATVFPCADDVPTASTLNHVRRQNVQNLAVTGLDSDGKVCIFTSASANVIVDARGFNP